MCQISKFQYLRCQIYNKNILRGTKSKFLPVIMRKNVLILRHVSSKLLNDGGLQPKLLNTSVETEDIIES
ncbi:hypothetical protein L1887_31464 [Cichorium endivia]|nr:hypothetical protein L1887_31464 [Cichorium endivia]